MVRRDVRRHRPSHPCYVIVVTVEEAGRGGNVAAPIARQVIEAMEFKPGQPRTPEIPVFSETHD